MRPPSSLPTYMLLYPSIRPESNEYPCIPPLPGQTTAGLLQPYPGCQNRLV